MTLTFLLKVCEFMELLIKLKINSHMEAIAVQSVLTRPLFKTICPCLDKDGISHFKNFS